MAATHAGRLEAGRCVFDRIVAGIDGSQQALEAARQAAIVQEPEGRLTLLSSWDVLPPLAGWPDVATRYARAEGLQRTTAATALVAACEYVAPYSCAIGKLVRGMPAGELLEEIERDEDTLVAVGSSGAGRLPGIVEGAVATEIVRRAPCSVLVARQADPAFPRSVVVGVDGSVESAAAYAAARYLAERFDAGLRALVARGGDGVDGHLVEAITDGEHADHDGPPAEALVEAAEAADLVVVGSRGLRGLRPLGRVSERVARSAGCSILIVRAPGGLRASDTDVFTRRTGGSERKDGHERTPHTDR